MARDLSVIYQPLFCSNLANWFFLFCYWYWLH